MKEKLSKLAGFLLLVGLLGGLVWLCVTKSPQYRLYYNYLTPKTPISPLPLPGAIPLNIGGTQ